MRKKIVALIAVVAVVATLSLCLTACTANTYQRRLEKAGYNVTITQDMQVTIHPHVSTASASNAKVDWKIEAVRINDDSCDYVTVYKFEFSGDAALFDEYEGRFLPYGYVQYLMGNLLFRASSMEALRDVLHRLGDENTITVGR